jgi:hypothetical protein
LAKLSDTEGHVLALATWMTLKQMLFSGRFAQATVVCTCCDNMYANVNAASRGR